MAKAKVIHSQDACMIAFKGNPKSPEPHLGVIKFPGGFVEVSRTSDNQYWAHITVNESAKITDSRLDYNYETSQEIDEQIPPIPHEDGLVKIAIKIEGIFEEADNE